MRRKITSGVQVGSNTTASSHMLKPAKTTASGAAIQSRRSGPFDRVASAHTA